MAPSETSPHRVRGQSPRSNASAPRICTILGARRGATPLLSAWCPDLLIRRSGVRTFLFSEVVAG
jgi:hypothetical protein